MNYRHAFHAGNHADVLKHVVLLALLDALLRKDTPCFVLDTHAGRGRYLLQDGDASRTGEAAAGILRLTGLADPPPALARYLAAAAAELPHYPGSPLLAARALRGHDRLAACELQAEEAAALRSLFAGDPRVAVHARDGYGAVRALLPPRVDGTRYARGLVLVDPPYEAQEANTRWWSRPCARRCSAGRRPPARSGIRSSAGAACSRSCAAWNNCRCARCCWPNC